MNQKVNELVKRGASLNLAIALLWTSLTSKERNQLSLEQCYSVWEYASIKSPEGSEAWNLLKIKAKSFESLKWILENILIEDTAEAMDVLELAIKKAKTIEDHNFLLSMIPSNTPRFSESLIILARKAKTFNQLVDICDKLSHSNAKRMVLPFVRKKAITLSDWYWIWELMPLTSIEVVEVCNEIKARILSFQDCQWILDNTLEESPLKLKVWNLVKERVEELK